MNQTIPTDHVRLFIAIAVPADIKAELTAVQQELRQTLSRSAIRWTPPEQVHLTLRFLGNVESARIQALVDGLSRACRGFAPLRLSAVGIGFFPNARRPRVIWAGVRDDTEQLGTLQQAIQEATLDFTAEPLENKFVGHLTVARIKTLNREEAKALPGAGTGAAERCFGHWTADSLELIRSELSSSGARYAVLERTRLAS